MTNKPPSDELRELITATKEHLTFIQELGIDQIKISPIPRDVGRSTKRQPSAPTAPPEKFSSIAEPVAPPRIKRPQPISAARAVAADSSPDVLFSDFAQAAEKLPRSTETFEDIWANIGNCTRCPLFQERTNIVHTEGNRTARLMFVGEAPGADEDAQARPFVGKAGQLLTRIIEAIGFKREEVVIGNVNRCRPPGNRPPTAEEAAMCKPFLLREIAVVQPEVIVVLGNTAMRNLLDIKEGITKLRGRFQDYKGIKVMPTFHPAYLLRDPSKKRETWEDLKKVRDYLDGKL